MATYASQEVGFGQAFMNTIMSALKTLPAGPLIATAKVRLSHDPAFNPTPTTTVAALAANEVSFSGYTAGGIAVSLSGPLNLSTVCQGMQTVASFLAATATPFVPDTATGYWIDDGTNVIAYEAFPPGSAPTFASPGDFLDLTVFFPGQLLQATS